MATDALILDLGNVFAFHDNARLFREMAKTFGTTPEAMSARLDAGLWDAVNRGTLSGDALRRELVSRLGAEVSPEAWFALWNCHFTIHDAMVRAVEPLVGRVKLVLLSNTHDQHVAYLRPRLPILERFDALVLSYEVHAIKPEKEIYALAVERAGVPASRACFFDDVQRYVDAAAQVGLPARLYTDAPTFLGHLKELGLS
jgi:putative hydrolase of the HAD superfamily